MLFLSIRWAVVRVSCEEDLVSQRPHVASNETKTIKRVRAKYWADVNGEVTLLPSQPPAATHVQKHLVFLVKNKYF